MIPFPAVTEQERRLVFQRSDGIFAIFNRATTQPPDVIEGSDGTVACLVAVKRSYYLYKPMMLPATLGGTMHTGQR